MFLFLWKVQLFFFSFANEPAQQNDPVKKIRVSKSHIYDRVMELAYTHGKLHGAPFFNACALLSCGHRSKAAMVWGRKIWPLMRVDNSCVFSSF